MEPTKKSPGVEAFLEAMAGRTSAITTDRCVNAPIGCGMPVHPDVDPIWEDGSTRFRDGGSLSEYRISGLCQTCQDEIFGR